MVLLMRSQECRGSKGFRNLPVKFRLLSLQHKIFSGKIIFMIYVNDCSIRVVQSYVMIFVQVLHTKIILQQIKNKLW